jgi:hypothetical protein
VAQAAQARSQLAATKAAKDKAVAAIAAIAC